MDRNKDTKSETVEESFFMERLVGTHHHLTTISDGDRKVEGRGITSEESQKSASEKWDKRK